MIINLISDDILIRIMKYNFIDLFCGAGGLSYGFEKSGLNCLAGIDYFKNAIETFKLNHKNSLGINGDIRKISIKNFKIKIKNQKVHIICGGPPCQGFSTIGPGDAEIICKICERTKTKYNCIRKCYRFAS